MKRLYPFLFNTPVNPVWLSVLRRGTALLVLVHLIRLWPDYPTLYGSSGVADAALTAPEERWPGAMLHPFLPKGYWLLLCYSYLCMAMISGWHPRIHTLALLLLHGCLFLTQPHFSFGFDYFCSSALFYCLISNSRPFGLRLMQLHLCLAYFFVGSVKLIGDTWRNGKALWQAVQQPVFSTASLFPAVPGSLAAYPLLWTAGGWAVITVELLYPLFIWPQITRSYWLCATIGLHLGIALFMGLYFFAAIMILWNLAAFHYPYQPGAATPARQPTH